MPGFAILTRRIRTTSLKIFDLEIKDKQKVGLVGPSGGGKSTITRLLMRFVDLQSGQISIGGHSIKNVTQESIRRAISYVPQEPLMFHRSLRENIAYGSPEASEDDITLAAKRAHAYEFINSLEDGFDTIVGERGIKLSGGQRQRVALARAILKDAPIFAFRRSHQRTRLRIRKANPESLGGLNERPHRHCYRSQIVNNSEDGSNSCA